MIQKSNVRPYFYIFKTCMPHVYADVTISQSTITSLHKISEEPT